MKTATTHLLHLDDFQPGQVIELGTCVFTDQDIVAFATQHDPRPVHLDTKAGRASSYGGLIASGWHTAAVLMRLLVGNLVERSAALDVPGVDKLRWLLPVRPGDTLTLRKIVRSVEPALRGDHGTVVGECEIHNQRGQKVMTMQTTMIFRRRQSDAVELPLAA